MAARPGEEMVATLFADIHYFYSPETTKPRHHRFDKGSYVYLYENAGARRARVEIANHAGTDDQDAFEGFLDTVTLRYSYKHSCLVTLIANQHQHPQHQQQQPPSPEEWHLPTYDPRNENKYHYPLHSLDIYFWTRDDALQFVNGARRVLPVVQCEILDEPASALGPPQQQQHHHHQHDMSAVVQQLEDVAISGSAQGGLLPPPPPPPPTTTTTTTSATGDYAPMAYNPAAPAAPEALRHREKTPPPPQDPSTDPRVMAVAYEQNQGQQPFSPAPFSPYFPHHQQQQQPLASPGFAPPGAAQHQQPLASPGFAPPPPPPPGQQQPLASPGFAPPPGGHAQFQRTNTLPVPGSPGFFPGAGTPQQPMQSMHAGMTSPPQAQQAAAAAAAAATPTPGTVPPPPPQQQAQSPPQQGHVDYGMHHQVYVPDTPGSSSSSIKKENAGRLERGMSGMLKKFEKKFG
jgi:hypothetical protein